MRQDERFGNPTAGNQYPPTIDFRAIAVFLDFFTISLILTPPTVDNDGLPGGIPDPATPVMQNARLRDWRRALVVRRDRHGKLPR